MVIWTNILFYFVCVCVLFFKKHFLLRHNLIFLTTFQAIEKKKHDFVIDLTEEDLSDCNTGKGFFFFKKVGKGNNSKYIWPIYEVFCVC